MSSCNKCGFDNPDEARFCNQCGTKLDEAAVRQAERRQITVFFSDLSGFTAMSEKLDPEDVHAVMGEIFKAATAIIERYGGRVDKLLGDAIMAVFGDPVAHEDDAERAVRAVMEIHSAVDELSPTVEPKIGRPLCMHTGITTGVVVTSSGTFDTADTGPLGDTINLAARLEDLSEPGEILVGTETAGLIDHVFELVHHGDHALKGKSAHVPVYKLVGFKSDRTEPSRRHSAFVGRHEELGILLGAVEKVRDGAGSVIGLRAEAGAGKTRLLAEFHDRVHEQVQWLEGRAYAYGENIPYALLIDLISNAVGIAEGDTGESIVAKLQAGVDPLVDDVERVLEPFHRLFGLSERTSAALDKDSYQERLLDSLASVVDGLCARAPTVLVLQDLHWADPSTVGMFSKLIETVQSPVVVVANYRPSFTGSLPGVRQIELQALSPRQSGELVASLLDGEPPPAELVEFLFGRTDGNPFYLEEIINSLLETDTLVRSNGSWRLVGELTEANLPSSVRGVIAARIDRLDGDRRKVLREASVVGRDFLYDVMRRVASETDTLDPCLEDLMNADLIRERDNQADLEYFFKHALTQDVAYEGLLKAERMELHARAAAAIEAQFAGRLEEVTETLAFHYQRGGVLDKAVHYLRAAGSKAMDRYALVEAQSHFESAYDLLTSQGPSPEVDAALVGTILDWAILFYYQARLLALGELLDRHTDAMGRLEDDRIRMWWHVWRGHATGFQLDQADNMRDLDAAIELAQRLGDEAGYAYAKTWAVWGYFIAGKPDDAVAAADEIRDWVTAHRFTDPYPYFKSLGTVTYVLSSRGTAQEVEQICNELIALGEEVGNNRCVAYGMQGLAFLAAVMLRFDEGIGLAREAQSIAKDPIYAETANLTRSAAATLAGESAEARAAVDELMTAVESGVDLPAPLFVGLADGVATMSEGRLTVGMDHLMEVRAEADRTNRVWERLFGDVYIGTIFSRVTTGEASRDLTRILRNPRFLKYVRRARKEAEPRLRAAMEEAEATGFRGIIPIIQYELAKLLIHKGDAAGARPILESCLERISFAGEHEGTERVKALLGSL